MLSIVNELKEEFDYVIIDEASQTDVATGFLALSSAVNAVIVGDSKQLPNVVTSEQKYKLKEIFNKYGISESYNYENHSLLDSVLCIFKNILILTFPKDHLIHAKNRIDRRSDLMAHLRQKLGFCLCRLHCFVCRIP